MKKLILFLVITTSSFSLFAQSVGIGTTNPNGKSVLELSSTTQGFLPPRMKTAEKTGLGLGAADYGMIVYDTDLTSFQYWDGSAWNGLGGSGSAWDLNGNTGINAPTNFIGTTDANDLYIKTNGSSRARFYSDGKISLSGTANITGTGGVSIGVGNAVGGNRAYAIGNYVEANHLGSMVLGDWSSSTPSTTQSAATDQFTARFDGGFRFFTASDLNANSGVYFDNIGQVGIGQEDPQAKLDILSDLGSADDIVKIGESGTTNKLKLSSGTTAFTFGGGIGTTTRHDITVNHSTGNVGIGLGAILVPNEKLTVDGLISVQEQGPIGGATAGYGKFYANSLDKKPHFLASDGADYDLTAGASYWTKSGTNLYNLTDNIGIGTNSPNGRLQFDQAFTNRKIVLYEKADNNHQFYGFGQTASELRYQTDQNDADHVFYSAVDATSSLELMRLEGEGNVGVGSSAPGMVTGMKKYFTISTGLGAPFASDGVSLELHGGSGDGSTPQSKIEFISKSTTGSPVNSARIAITNSATNTQHGVMRFYTRGTGSLTERMTILESGNVGIGATNPSQTLEVVGNGQIGTTGEEAFIGDVGHAGHAAFAHLGAATTSNYALLSDANGVTYLNSSSSQYIGFRTNNTDRMRLLGNGNFGIGTTSPNEKLEVNGNIRISAEGSEVNRTTDGADKTGNAHLLPIGYATANTDGSFITGGSGMHFTPNMVVEKIQDGQYSVTVSDFTSDFTKNYPVVNVSIVKTVATISQNNIGFITWRPINPKEIIVETYDLNGDLSGRAFSIVVFNP